MDILDNDVLGELLSYCKPELGVVMYLHDINMNPMTMKIIRSSWIRYMKFYDMPISELALSESKTVKAFIKEYLEYMPIDIFIKLRLYLSFDSMKEVGLIDKIETMEQKKKLFVSLIDNYALKSSHHDGIANTIIQLYQHDKIHPYWEAVHDSDYRYCRMKHIMT